MAGRWLSDAIGTKFGSWAAGFLKLTPQSTPAGVASGNVWVDSASNRLTSYDGSQNQQYASQADVMAMARNIAVTRGY